MDSEIKNFIKVWIIAMLSICYCYYIPKNISQGFKRLIFLLPIIFLFTVLPLLLTSAYLGGTTAFYLVWLGNSKLILFAFDLGPLSDTKNLIQFLSVALMPVKFISENSQKRQSPNLQKYAVFALKVLALAIIVCAYECKEIYHTSVLYLFYCCRVYLSVDLLIAVSAGFVQAVLGLQMEPHFDEPYLATSLQNFWGQKWNLMVTGILRHTVYLPTLEYSSRILSKMPARALGVFASFIVSGLMHELLFYYVTRMKPTWEVTWFFVLHGVSTAIEVAVKKAVAGRWKFPVMVSRLLTLGYVMITSVWLFFPQLLSNGMDEKANNELRMLVEFVRRKLSV